MSQCMSRLTFFPRLPSVVHLKVFLLPFIILRRTQLQVSFGSPKTTPACSNSIFTVLLGHLTPFPPLVFFFCLWVLSRPSCFSTQASCHLCLSGYPVYQGRALLNLVTCSLKINLLSWSLIHSRTTFHSTCPSRASQSLLFPSSGLGSYYLSSSLLRIFWTPILCLLQLRQAMTFTTLISSL